VLAQFSLRLPGGRIAPAEARRCLRRFHDELEPELAQIVSLLVSELVSNAVTHGGDGLVFVDADVSASAVRVEVEDGGPGFTPPAGGPVPSRGNGFGLYLVDEIADRWGVETTGRGNRVWFELDL